MYMYMYICICDCWATRTTRPPGHGAYTMARARFAQARAMLGLDKKGTSIWWMQRYANMLLAKITGSNKVTVSIQGAGALATAFDQYS